MRHHSVRPTAPRRTGTLRRLALVLTSGATAAAVVLAGATAPAGAVTPRADRSADWLAGQLDGGLVVSEYQTETGWARYTDHGLSLDVFFAFDALGVKNKKQRRILAAIEPEAGDYVGFGDEAYAGAHGKLLTAVLAQGLDPAEYAGGGLVQRLEGLVDTTGTDAGRAKDASSWGDNSNTLGQSFVVTALAGAGSGLADETAGFLLQQQCAEGYFRLLMDSADHTCDGGTPAQSGASVDATAAAVLALVGFRTERVPGVRRAAVSDALADARRWLVDQQRRNGGFLDEGTVNANSTGLAAQALLALGKDAKARRAAAWLRKHQVTPKLARTTAFRKRDIGAVAHNRAALRAGRQDGITRDVRYQWRRATAQAAAGLDAR